MSSKSFDMVKQDFDKTIPSSAILLPTIWIAKFVIRELIKFALIWQRGYLDNSRN